VTAGGVATHLSLSGDGLIELERSPAARSVEVSFLKADLSRSASC
jgi:hypothetical protein